MESPPTAAVAGRRAEAAGVGRAPSGRRPACRRARPESGARAPGDSRPTAPAQRATSARMRAEDVRRCRDRRSRRRRSGRRPCTGAAGSWSPGGRRARRSARLRPSSVSGLDRARPAPAAPSPGRQQLAREPAAPRAASARDSRGRAARLAGEELQPRIERAAALVDHAAAGKQPQDRRRQGQHAASAPPSGSPDRPCAARQAASARRCGRAGRPPRISCTTNSTAAGDVQRVALQHPVADLARDGDAGGGQVVEVDLGRAAALHHVGERPCAPLRTRPASPGVLRACGCPARCGPCWPELGLLGGEEVEIGADRAAQVGSRSRSPCRYSACRIGRKRRAPSSARAVEHLLLGAVVVVEGADREAGAADDVAHRGRLEAQLARTPARAASRMACRLASLVCSRLPGLRYATSAIALGSRAASAEVHRRRTKGRKRRSALSWWRERLLANRLARLGCGRRTVG